jgi:hypothetical protein
MREKIHYFNTTIGLRQLVTNKKYRLLEDKSVNACNQDITKLNNNTTTHDPGASEDIN